MKDVYLSVDLDYWGSFESVKIESVEKFIDKIISLNIPIYIVKSHETILRYINKYKLRKIINVDYHADIVNENSPYSFCDGSWANFYKYKLNCIFEWRHPRVNKYRFRLFSGRCDDCTVEEWRDIPTSYEKIEEKNGIHSIEWNNIVECCIAISPSYLCSNMSWLANKYNIFKKWGKVLRDE